MPLNTLEDLLVCELHDLHSAAKQWMNALPKMARAASSLRLRRGFEGQIEQSHRRVQCLEEILDRLRKSARPTMFDTADTTVDVLMPLGEWVTVDSSKAPRRRQQKSYGTDLTASAAEPMCASMEALLQQGEKIIEQAAQPQVKDAGLIAQVQRVEHYEIAGYRAARAHARLLRDIETERSLEQTLQEIERTDETLTELAEREINIEASRT